MLQWSAWWVQIKLVAKNFKNEGGTGSVDDPKIQKKEFEPDEEIIKEWK